MSADEIRNMSDEDILDMDYFLHEDDDFYNEVDREHPSHHPSS